jgi:predicted kinase
MSDRHSTGCLIAIAGAIGSGKSTIADAVSRRLDIPVHSIDDDKRAVGAMDPEFPRWVDEGIPFPDDFRRRVYERTLGHLVDLARDQPRVIVEETFHRAELREPFFRAAEKLFGSICLVEIAVAPDVAVAHLQKRARDEADHMAGRAMFDAFAELADPLVGADLVVPNNGQLDPAVNEVCRHLEGLVANRSADK